MTKISISFDDEQMQQLEKIVIDQDEHGALIYLEDLRKMIKHSQIGCNPLEFKIREGVDKIIDKTKKYP